MDFENLVDVIIETLYDRRHFCKFWDYIDDEVKKDIKQFLRNKNSFIQASSFPPFFLLQLDH